MLLIKAKARECVEEVNFKLGPTSSNGEPLNAGNIDNIRKEVYEDEDGAMMLNVTNVLDVASEIYRVVHRDDQEDNYVVLYQITQGTLQKWGLDKIKIDNDENGQYIIKFNEKDASVVDVYNTLGYDGMYSLSELEKLDE
jgi:hypothetical protein